MAPAPLAGSLANKVGGVNTSRCHPYVPGYVIENKTTSGNYSLKFLKENQALSRRQKCSEWERQRYGELHSELGGNP